MGSASLRRHRHQLRLRSGQKCTHLGPRVELNCILLSLPVSRSMTEIWSPLQILTTVASNCRALPLTAVPFDFAEGAGALAYRHARFSFAVFSAARRRSIPPLLASMPACQSTTRARPAATRCSATLPAGCRTRQVSGQIVAIRMWRCCHTCSDEDRRWRRGCGIGTCLKWRGRSVRQREELYADVALQ